MTFSNPEVVAAISRTFVCAWKNVNPQQRFDDGMYPKSYTDQLRQLANGTADTNVTTLIVSADGAVAHAVPGFWQPKEFLAQVEFGLDQLKAGADARRDAHAVRAGEAAGRKQPGDRELARVHAKLAKGDVRLEELLRNTTAGIR